MPTEEELVELASRRNELRAQYVRPLSERPISRGRGISHAVLICSNVEQTIKFYDGLLGFPLVEVAENRDYDGSTHFFFDVGNKTMLGFFDFPGLGLEQAVEAIGGVQHIAISVTQGTWDEIRVRLDDAGIPYVGPEVGIPESMYFKGPDDVGIEILSDPLMYFAGRFLDQ